MPKIAYYALARVNEPVILFAEDESWRLQDNSIKTKIYLVSDHEDLTGTTARFALYDLSGKILLEKSWSGNYPPGTTFLGEIDSPLAHTPEHGVVIGRLTISDPVRQERFCFERLYGAPTLEKALHLPETELNVESNVKQANGETLLTVKVTNPGNMAALNVRTAVKNMDFTQVFWQQNYQHILPGESRIFTAKLTGEQPLFYALELYGWNHPEKVF